MAANARRNTSALMVGLMVVGAPRSFATPRGAAPTCAASELSVPFSFEQNRGQAPKDVSFLARRRGALVAIRPSGLSVTLRRRTDGSAATVHLRMAGASVGARPLGVGKLRGVVNCFLGSDRSRWVVGAPTYQRVRQVGSRRGVDVEYYGRNGSVEYDVTVRPGASVADVRFDVRGASSVSLSGGDLVCKTPAGYLRWSRPIAYQYRAGKRVPVPARYRMIASGEPARVGFAVGPYDRSRPLVIDPRLVWSTLFGGSGTEAAQGVGLDSVGDVYIGSHTDSADLPAAGSAYVGGWDCFAAKLTNRGSALVWCTYFGGAHDDYVAAVAVRGGTVAVVGSTHSTDFPRPTASCSGFARAVDGDTFVATVDAGTGLLRATTSRGFSEPDSGRTVAIQSTGHVIVGNVVDPIDYYDPDTGFTIYFWDDVYVQRLTPDLVQAAGQWTFWGDGFQNLTAMCVDADDTICLGGDTQDPAPVTTGSYRTEWNGTWDTYVARLWPNMALMWCTYLGGGGNHRIEGIAAGPSAAVTVVGSTAAAWHTTPGAYQGAVAGQTDCFIDRLTATGSALVFSTCLGGANDDYARSVAVDPEGRTCVVGITLSPDFPIAGAAFDTTHNGGEDAFVAWLSADGSTLASSTFVGSAESDQARGVALNAQGDAVVAGSTQSAAFPTTPGAFDRTLGGGQDGWIACFTQNRESEITVEDVSQVSTLPVVLKATLMDAGLEAPIVGETVRFHIGGAEVGAGVTNAEGQASCTYVIPESLGSGAKAVGASWFGDGTVFGNWGYGTLTVTKAGTSLYVPDCAGIITTPVGLRAYLKRLTDNRWIVGKSVAFQVDFTDVGKATTDANGRAQLTWTIPDGPSVRIIDAQYSGSDAYQLSTGTGFLEAQTVATKMAAFDRTVRLTDRTELKARLLRSDNVPLYGKGIRFYVDGTFVITRNTDVDGYAKWPVYDVPDGAGAGARTILSEWPGNAGYAAISKTATLTVLKAIPYIWVLGKSVPYGGVANLYAYFRRLYDYQKQTGKTVDFKIDGTPIQTVVTDGVGVARYLYPTAGLGYGGHTIRCEFAGDAWLDAGYGENYLNIY